MTARPLAASSATSLGEDGSTERAEFRGEPGNRVFTYVHLPGSPPRAAAVICSPLHGEFVRNYRREVLLARALATSGVGVLRFHYRFTGNSDGDGADLTFESMCDDALDGIERLRADAPSGPLFVVGTRWGGLIAASAAGRHPTASLVLWEPLLDAGRFFKDAFRRQLVRDVRREVGDPTSGRELEARLKAGQPVDVVANRLEPAFYRSSVGRSLETELGTAPRDVLVVQVAATGTIRPELDRLAGRWRDAGLRIDVETRPGDPISWLAEDRYAQDTTRTLTDELIDLTARWVSERAGGGAA